MDLAGLVADGRARVRGRRRRRTAVGAAAAAVAAVVAVSALTAPGGAARRARTHPARLDAPTVHLADAQPAVEGRDYDVLASHTNDNLDRDNGQYFDGVTNDGWSCTATVRGPTSSGHGSR